MSLSHTTARAIQGVEPSRLMVAETAQELGEAVAACAESGQAVCDYGVCHHGLGHAPPAGHAQITGPSGVLEHYVDDMTVRVSGWTTLGELQAALGHKRQYLPIDGAGPEQTVAELIAHNVYGPLRQSQGNMRDLLLGARFVDGSGKVLTVGGRTVKNVAGYDVTRLLVGNLNTLGLIADATIKTAATPEQVTQVALGGFDPRLLDEHLTKLVVSDASPWSLAWVSPGSTLHLGYAGDAGTCAAQAAALGPWLAEAGYKGAAARREVSLADDEAARQARVAGRRERGAEVKLIVPPGQTGRLLTELTAAAGSGALVEALPGHGIVHVAGNWSVEEAAELDARIMGWVKPAGMRVWLRRPGDSPKIAPFAPAQEEWVMLRQIKQTLDRGNILNPGRMV